MFESQNLEELKEEIEEIKASLPAHSIPPSLLMRLEELEEKLEVLSEELGENDASA